jgi:UDP-apiose/xylose synthase
MKVILIGCGGFVGSHLLDRLLTEPDMSVEGWDREADRILAHLDNPQFTFHQDFISSARGVQSVEHAIRFCDVVINLAAICNPAAYNTEPVRVIRSNFADLVPIVEACARDRVWLLHFSTSEVYGRTLASYVSPDVYDDESLYELDEDSTPLVMGPILAQRWTYACAKQLLERLIFAYHEELGLPFTIVRPLNFFGSRMDYIPGRDGSGLPRVLASFTGALLDGRPLRVVDGGRSRRTIVSIHDAVEAVMLILRQRDKAEGQIFNIGNRENEVTILELADLMRRTYARITGDPSYDDHPIEFVTGTELYGQGYEDCDRRMPKIDKARDQLGWVPRIPLEDLLLDAMTYYHERHGSSARLDVAHAPVPGPASTG